MWLFCEFDTVLKLAFASSIKVENMSFSFMLVKYGGTKFDKSLSYSYLRTYTKFTFEATNRTNYTTGEEKSKRFRN